MLHLSIIVGRKIKMTDVDQVGDQLRIGVTFNALDQADEEWE
jgi:hypothetical protein